MAKKIFLLVGIVVALLISYTYVVGHTFTLYFNSTILAMNGFEGEVKLTTEQTTLLVFAIISAILLVCALIFLIKNFKTDKYWVRALFLAVMGAATIILPDLIINWITIASELKNPIATEEYKTALILQYVLILVHPIITITLMTISYVNSRKEQKEKNSF